MGVKERDEVRGEEERTEIRAERNREEKRRGYFSMPFSWVSK